MPNSYKKYNLALMPHKKTCTNDEQVCQMIPDAPSALGHLDGDTAVSHGTYVASLMAAGAVTHAVDKVGENY
jgi:acetoin utilization deacetylase AcuC-like enzyme